jgi:hypothetical protein
MISRDEVEFAAINRTCVGVSGFLYAGRRDVIR